jgi:SAM-dependent methyltransferase
VGYDKFAKYYDQYWTTDVPSLFEKALNRLVLTEIAEGAEILDLCCGTGQLCERLARRHFKLTGLDNSPEMLAFASKNAPSAIFSLQNAESFSFPKRFSAVISMFDSINHFLSEDALTNLFASVRKALEPDGIFFFDINDITAFENGWEEGFAMVDSISACIVKPLFDHISRDIRYHVTIFEENSIKDTGAIYRRIDTEVKERYYESEIILALLRKSGFNEVCVFDGSADLKIKPFNGRLFFLARPDQDV